MSSDFSINPHGEPFGQRCFVQIAGCYGEHCPDSLVCRNIQVVPVECTEHGEAAPGEALVSVEKRVIPGDAHRKHGCLVEKLGVHVVSAKRRLGSMKGRIEKIDSRTSSVDG